MGYFEIKDRITISDIQIILKENKKIKLSDDAMQRIESCRAYLDDRLQRQTEPIYGINTGFGALYNQKISHEDLGKLQTNLLLSHACGTGNTVPKEIVKLMLLLKVQSLSYGNSGVKIATVERLMSFFNEGIYPLVYEQGSLGASGDLAPLAHLCLPIIGYGDVVFEGEDRIYNAKEIENKFGLKPLQLDSKEGLALINGTQFMSAYAVSILLKAHKLTTDADRVACLSLEAFDGRLEPFHPALHLVRNHKGQVQTAQYILARINGSEIAVQPKQHVQDPYAFRCIPQVHGASKDSIQYITDVVTTEINSVTDNPNIFPEHDMIVSGGNFHGQPLALVLDFLAIALAELGSISERRTYQLISGQRGLPPFLVPNPGLHSGMMIPQYTAASIVSQNKQLCTPASVDSIVSSNGQEDHVSMGANAATKCYKVAINVQTIIAIELLNASQAIEFRRPLKSSTEVETFLNAYRELVPFIPEDKTLYTEIQKSVTFLNAYED